MRHDFAKDSYISKKRLKTTLNASKFAYVDIDNKRYFHNNKRFNGGEELCSIFSILNPDKEQAIVLINHDDYINSLRKIFDDSSKSKKTAKDPTIARLTTVKNYHNTFKRVEVNKSEKKEMRPKSSQIARANSLPKNHKHYEYLLEFTPISIQQIHFAISFATLRFYQTYLTH